MARILVVNPNTSDDVTALIRDEARRAAGPGTELEVHTAPFGVEYIETRIESLFAAAAVAEVVAGAGASLPAFDAVLVAAFGDPGLPALKELLDVPVIGISEAAFATAALLGRRFPSSPSPSGSARGTATAWNCSVSRAGWHPSAPCQTRCPTSRGCGNGSAPTWFRLPMRPSPRMVPMW